VGLYKRVYSSTKPLKREYSSPKPLRRVYFSPTPLRRVYSSPKPLRRVYFSPKPLIRVYSSHIIAGCMEGAAADSIFRSFSDLVRQLWYQDISGAGGQIQAFIFIFGYSWSKVGLHKGFPRMYYTWGGSRRLLLKTRPQWSEI